MKRKDITLGIRMIALTAFALFVTTHVDAQFNWGNDEQSSDFHFPIYPYNSPAPRFHRSWWPYATYPLYNNYYNDYPPVHPVTINLKNLNHPVVPDYNPYANMYPWGTVLTDLSPAAVLATASASVSKENMSKKYYYDDGQFFFHLNNGYVAIPSPQGYIIPELPQDADKVPMQGADYFYFAGTFFQPVPGGYVVIPAPVGAIVYSLPPWAHVLGSEGEINGYELGTDIYQVVYYKGAKAYMVVQDR
ncbi:MAG: DUF6515 family protein [Bacteroidales bacterium]|nr:DUF6515 family protein [Bacteroidales bacterium]